MSEVRVNKLSPRSGTTVTLGDSGDTITIPSGVTFDASSGGLAGTLTTAAQPNITSVGTLTSFTSTGIDDNASSTAMTISSSGVVSIGTTSSSGGWSVKVAGSNAPLELARTAGDTVERSQLGMEREGTFVGQFKSDATNLWLEASTGALIINTGGGTERMRIDSSGNVGIGNTVASTINSANGTGNLVVGSGSGTEGITIYSGTTGEGTLQFADASTGAGTYVGQINYNHSNNFMSFGANGSERMRIDSSGNVGIGETAPLGKLHIKSADSGGTPNSQYDELVLEQNGNNCGMTILCNSPGDGAIYFGDSADNDIGGIAYSHFDNKMFFKVNGSERMRIDSSGRLLFGTTSTFAGGSTLMNIALNTTNSTSSPFPNGIVFVKQNFQGSNAVALDFEDFAGNRKGSIQFNEGGTSFNTSSDYRLKENVNYDFDATTRLKQLRPARFNFIADADTTVDGFIAHEVQSIVPEAISGTHNEVEVWKEGEELPEGVSVGDNKLDGEGNTIPVYQGIDQSKLVPLLVKTIQELEARITQLENA